MSTVTTTKERVIKASETCPDAKGVLKELFPYVFEEEWKEITDQVMWTWEKGVVGRGDFLHGWYRGAKVVYWSGYKKGDGTGGFELQPADDFKVKIEKFNDLIKIMLKS